MQPRTQHTVLATRDGVADLLQRTQNVLTWPVRTALASAFSYLDDALPVLAPRPLPPAEHPVDAAEHTDSSDVAARIETLRADLLGVLEQVPGDVDPYAVGHAAGELGAALRELTQGRPA